MRLTASRASITSSGGAVLDAIQQEDPTLDLNFEETKTLTDDVSGNNLVTFSRASSGTYVGSDGLIKTAVTDAPRFDHDPVTGESLGLLIEESRTNLLTYSEEFDDGSYLTAANGGLVVPTKTPNQATAPDGSLTADKIDYPAVSAAGTYSLIYRNAVTLSGSHSSSIYLRGAVGGEKVYLYYIVDGIYSNTLCTLTTEWQRFSVIFTGGTLSYWHLGVDLRSGSGQVAQSASTIYAWGAQVEANASFPTSYIPTSGSTVTRAADIATIEGTNFSSWYNQSEGTVFSISSSVTNLQSSAERYPYLIYQDDSNRHGFGYRSGGFDNFVHNTFAGGSRQFSPVDAGDPTYTNDKTAYSYSNTGGSTVHNSQEWSSSTSDLSVINPTILYIGGTAYLNGHISRLAYFPTRKTDQQLIDLTT